MYIKIHLTDFFNLKVEVNGEENLGKNPLRNKSLNKLIENLKI